jgi:uncharacterized protein DUF4265
MSNHAEPTAKVLFRVVESDGADSIETLWAFDLGENRYKLDNSPFYAYGVSWGDTVLAPHDDTQGHATFHSVLVKSGYRTVRVMFDPPVRRGNESDITLKGLVKLGSEYERANAQYIVVSIPPSVDLARVVGYLVERKATWEHADPTYDEYHAKDA